MPKGIYIRTPERRKIASMNLIQKGEKLSEEHKRKISNAFKGERHPFFGKHLSKEHKQKISLSEKNIRKPGNWKGGKIKRPDGYMMIYAPGHSRSHNNYILEHLLVWERTYNKRIPKGYLIHHLNGIKDDNRPENLIAIKVGDHVDQAKPYKKRIRELEIENARLKQIPFWNNLECLEREKTNQ